MTTAILQIVAAVAGMLATWWIGKKALQWLQRYYDYQNSKQVGEVKKDSEELAKKIQKESDDLKKKEEEFLNKQS